MNNSQILNTNSQINKIKLNDFDLINNDIYTNINQSDSKNIETISNINDENNQNNIYTKNMFH